MPTTMKLIAKNVLGSSASSVTFSDIPGTYTDLILTFSGRQDVNYADCYLRFNSDSGSNYSFRRLDGSGSAASSTSASSQTWLSIYPGVARNNMTASTFGNSEIYIPNYAGSTNKSVSATCLNENNATGAQMAAIAGLWSSTSAITSVILYPDTGGNFVSGSSFFLYGITKA